MLNDKAPEFPREYTLVALDTTQYWNMALMEDFAGKVKRILTVCVVDRSTRTYICSSTPSYWLTWAGWHQLDLIDGLPEAERDRLYELWGEELEYEPWSDDYCNCADVDNLPEWRKKPLTRHNADSEVDEVVEDVRGNPVHFSEEVE